MLLNYDFDLSCRTSPRRCSGPGGSLCGWIWIFFYRDLYINTKGRFPQKIMIIFKWRSYLTLQQKKSIRFIRKGHRCFIFIGEKVAECSET